MLDKNRQYRVGEPIHYTSIYGYPKRRFRIEDVATGQTVGTAKEEIVPGVNGKESTRVFYTRDISRNPPMLRFYDSPEALIVAFGGQLERKTVKKPAAKVAAKRAAKKPAAKRRVVKKAVKPSGRVKKAA
jgi:hypothetical protein